MAMELKGPVAGAEVTGGALRTPEISSVVVPEVKVADNLESIASGGNTHAAIEAAAGSEPNEMNYYDTSLRDTPGANDAGAETSSAPIGVAGEGGGEEGSGVVWRNADNDQPVKIIGPSETGPDGREYVPIEGSNTGIPVDEIESVEVPTDATGEGGNVKELSETATADEPDAKKEEPLLDADAQAADNSPRVVELSEKVKNGTATGDEIKEFRDLKRPEKRKEELQAKAENGTITDSEAEELGRLNNPETSSGELTPEQQQQQLEKLGKEIEDQGTEIMTKMMNGEDVAPEEVEAFRQKMAEKDLMKDARFTQEQAREATQRALGKDKHGSERESLRMKSVKEDIQKLMAIEFQILALPKRIQELRGEKDKAVAEAKKRHADAESAQGPDRLKKKQLEYAAYMQVAQIKGRIAGIRFEVPILEAQRQDTEQAVRRKLGVTSGLGAVVEFGLAKTRIAVTEVSVNAATALYDDIE